MILGWGVVQDFIARIANQPPAKRCYRGQQDAEWPLAPSVFRSGAVGISSQSTLNAWQRQAARFVTPLPITSIDWLTLAQHYGLATPLLDWTASPLTALFFACGGALDDKPTNGCVWMSQEADFTFVHDTLLLGAFENTTGPFLIDAAGRNARSTAQDSLLSLHSPGDPKPIPGEQIFIVPGERKNSTLAALRALGFSDERLHADITRLVAAFRMELEMDHFFEEINRRLAAR